MRSTSEQARIGERMAGAKGSARAATADTASAEKDN
jgi:hypothetical protein